MFLSLFGSVGQNIQLNNYIQPVYKAGNESLESYLWDRRSRAPLKKCGILKLDSSVHRLDSDMVSRSCHRGRWELDFWRAGEKKRLLLSGLRRWPPKQFWPVLLQQPSWGPTFLCIGTSAGSWGIKHWHKGQVVLHRPQIKKRSREAPERHTGCVIQVRRWQSVLLQGCDTQHQLTFVFSSHCHCVLYPKHSPRSPLLNMLHIM